MVTFNSIYIVCPLFNFFFVAYVNIWMHGISSEFFIYIYLQHFHCKYLMNSLFMFLSHIYQKLLEAKKKNTIKKVLVLFKFWLYGKGYLATSLIQG